MINKIKEYFNNRKLKKIQQHFNSGFSFAFAEYFSGRLSLTEIENYTDYLDYDYFNQGIKEAYFILKYRCKLTNRFKK